MCPPGIQPSEPGPLPGSPNPQPSPIPPGGNIPTEVPPLPDSPVTPDEEIPPVEDPGIGDPGEPRQPDYLPGGPSNPHPHL